MNKLKDIYKELKNFSWVKTNDDWDYVVFNGKKYNLDTSIETLYEVVKQYNKTLTLSKVDRLKVLQNVLRGTKNFLKEWKDVITTPQVHHLLEDDYYELNINSLIDNKHIKIDELDNKGKLEKYLYVCGVQHQFNLELDKFIKRIEEKINKEYTSQRTIDAADGNDWKALSHAIRVLLEIKELLDTSNIQFPLKDKDFLLDIKLGKVSREEIDNYFEKELSSILERVQKNELNWKYNETLWNLFILNEVKHDFT
jgi:hypothetical protein